MTDNTLAKKQSRPSILVVDDAADSRLMLNLRLQREGYIVYSAGSGLEALEIVNQEGLPHLVILDMIMPGMNGFEVANRLRRNGEVPIIFLSYLDQTEVEDWSMYATEFIQKPCAFPEILECVRHVLVSTPTELVRDPEFVIDERLRINFDEHYAVVENKRIAFTPAETRLLLVLYNNRGRVLSPGFLLAKAWDPLRKGVLESLWFHIHRIRYKIETDPKMPRYIVTSRGEGYCLLNRSQIRNANKFSKAQPT